MIKVTEYIRTHKTIVQINGLSLHPAESSMMNAYTLAKELGQTEIIVETHPLEGPPYKETIQIC